MALGASAQQANGTYSFLKATNSARVAALGGLPLPLYDDDIQLSLFNPATISEGMNNKLGLSYVDYYTDINFATAQYSRTFENIGSFAATVQYHNYGHFDEASESGIVMGDFSSSDFSVNLGWGRRLTPHWSIGATFKYAGLQYESGGRRHLPAAFRRGTLPFIRLHVHGPPPEGAGRHRAGHTG